jgi:hypothetical protein
MKVTINGNVSKEALKIILENQKEKVKVIDDYCKENKFFNFSYRDSELEYEYQKAGKSKVEIRSELKPEVKPEAINEE